jgi:ComF family protein
LHPFFNQFLDTTFTLLAPRACAVCGGNVARLADGTVCGGCWAAYRTLRDAFSPACDRCGRWRLVPTGVETAPVARPGCDQCADAPFERARSCGPYRDGLRRALLALKRKPFIPLPLRELVGETWGMFPELQNSDAIVPIPLADGRRRERGYNQTELLAGLLSEISNLPVVPDALARTVETKPHRAGMDDRARAQSLENAFLVVRPRLVAGKRILLVDDVFTSGATLREATAALHVAEVEAVTVFTVARTLRDGG